MAKKHFNVAIMHGHGRARHSVQKWIKEAGYKPRVLIDEYGAGVVFERLRNIIWDEIHCVVIIMTADDVMEDGSLRARENVIFELGYSFGAFDSLDEEDEYSAEEAIIIMKEKGVSDFANMRGITYLSFEKKYLSKLKVRLIKLLDDRFGKAQAVEDYPELRRK